MSKKHRLNLEETLLSFKRCVPDKSMYISHHIEDANTILFMIAWENLGYSSRHGCRNAWGEAIRKYELSKWLTIHEWENTTGVTDLYLEVRCPKATVRWFIGYNK